MKALESRLGVSLFNRDGRKSVPNAPGHRLSRNGQAIRLAEEQASVLADQSAQGAVGELRIGAPPIVAGRFLSTATARFIRENPSCVVEMRTGLVHELRAMLERGQVDIVLGLRSLADAPAGLEFEPIIDDRVGILCRTGHAMTNLGQVMPPDLEDWLEFLDFDHPQFHRPMGSIRIAGTTPNPVEDRFLALLR